MCGDQEKLASGIASPLSMGHGRASPELVEGAETRLSTDFLPDANAKMTGTSPDMTRRNGSL